MVSRYEVVPENTQLFSRLFAADLDPKTSVILEQAPNIPLAHLAGSARTEVLEYKEQKIVIKTTASDPAILVITDTFYPGWQATIDDQPAHIYRANYALRAIVVPAGSHTVRVTYNPFSLKLGVGFSLASGALFLILALIKYPQPDSNRRFTG